MRSALLSAVLLCSSSAFAQANPTARLEITDRVALPLDGSPIDLTPLVRSNEARLRIIGTLSNGLDGSEVDAFSRRASGQDFSADGPYVVFPGAATPDLAPSSSHSYEVTISDLNRPLTFSFNLRRLAAQQLVTRSEAMSALSGRIELQLVQPPLPASASSGIAHRPVQQATPKSFAWVAGLAIPLVPTLLLGLMILRARRRDELDALLVRGRRAAQAISREALELGPAFAEVVTASHRSLEAAERVRAHARALEASRQRIVGDSEAVQNRRRELHRERRLAVERLERLVEQLEATAARLAAHEASQLKPQDLDAASHELGRELSTALRADEEALQSVRS